MADILYVPADHPLNRVGDRHKERIRAAQTDDLASEFPTAFQLCERALADLKIAVRPPADAKGVAAAALGDQPTKDLTAFYAGILAANGVPQQAVGLQAA